jgi:hypothetical protein
MRLIFKRTTECISGFQQIRRGYGTKVFSKTLDIVHFAKLPCSTATEEVYVHIGQIKLYIAIKNTIGSAPVNRTVHECNGNKLKRNRVTENSVCDQIDNERATGLCRVTNLGSEVLQLPLLHIENRQYARIGV